MKRNALEDLKQWKASPRRKPLILRGAREVGFTYLPRQFAQRDYEGLAYFNCEEDLPLEVKAGIDPRSKSLRSYELQFSPSHLLRTTLLNLKRDGKTCNCPLYAISLLPQLLDSGA